MSYNSISVALVDDHALFLDGMVAILSQVGRYTLVARGSTSEDAVRIATKVQPDVLLLDVELYDAPASQTIKRIKRAGSRTHIVMLTMHQDRVLRDELLKVGAAHYLTKTTPTSLLLAAIDRFSTHDAQDDRRLDVDTQQPKSGLLSSREHEVLRFLASANKNRQIADLLNISEGTVKRHTTNIYRKLGATSRLDAVQRATRLGIIGGKDL